ncbi:MAG: HNH endonuclease [Candidatus Bathyarchaeota archaeon]|nr:HNH endonuclease [Candidatus Bathyarchaeota archaeon]
MFGQKSSSKRNRLIEDIISVEDILLEYIIDNGWKDYNKFAKKLTEKIVEKQPSTQEDLVRLVGNFAHPFFAFNGITKEQFVVRFPLTELLRQSRIPRQSVTLTTTKKRSTPKRRAISKKLRLLILERDGYRCCTCGRTAKETKLEVDHRIPVAKGGTDSLNNLWTLCIDCNRGKSDLYI